MLYIINVVLFTLLAIMWNKNDWLNFSIKTIFVAATIANAFYALQAFGYIVKGGL